MRKKLASFMLGTLVLTIGGCGKSHESVRADTLSTMNDIAATLKNVTDEASAKDAASKLKSLGEKLKKLKADDEALGKWSDEDEKKWMTAHENDFKASMDEFMKQSMRVMMDPKLSPALKDAMPSMN